MKRILAVIFFMLFTFANAAYALLEEVVDDSFLDTVMDQPSAVWFENRIGYGAPKARVDRYVGLTRREAVDLVINELRTYKDSYELPLWFEGMKPLGQILKTLPGEKCGSNYVETSLEEAWLKSIYTSKVPQFDRLSTFWLDHFSVGYNAYLHPHAFARHTKIIRNWRSGSFLDLLYASLSDPSLIVYLNNDQSDRRRPNENLAREFFELFALGEGNYSERDVKQFARLLTGRAFNTAEEDYEFMVERAIRPNAHILGRKYKKARTFVDDLDKHSAYGELIIKKLYKEYVTLSEPSTQDMRMLKARFIQHNSDIISLLEAIISSKTFWTYDRELTLIKSPLGLFAGTARTLNSSGNFPVDFWYWQIQSSILDQFGQSIINPPSIDGWPKGKEWLQGQSIDRRSQELAKNYSDQIGDYYFNTPVSPKQAQQAQKYIDFAQHREEAVEKFFASARKDQLMIEGLVLFARPFDRRKWSQMKVTFRDVRFNEDVYDQITLGFTRGPKSGDPWNQTLSVAKELVSNDFITGAAGLKGEGGSVRVHTKLPYSRSSSKHHGLTGKKRKILSLLLRATSVLVKEKDFQMNGNIGSAWREWLTKAVLKNKLDDVRSQKSPVRLFSPPKSEYKSYFNGSDFNCAYQTGKEQDMLDAFDKYSKIREDTGIEAEITMALSKKAFNSEILKPFAESLGKLLKDSPVLKEKDRSAYLMPNAVNTDWHSVLTSVEYNLR